MKVKTKRRICVTVATVALLAMLAIVDSVERGGIPVGSGAIISVAIMAIGVAMLWKAGAIKL